MAAAVFKSINSLASMKRSVVTANVLLKHFSSSINKNVQISASSQRSSISTRMPHSALFSLKTVSIFRNFSKICIKLLKF